MSKPISEPETPQYIKSLVASANRALRASIILRGPVYAYAAKLRMGRS